MAEQSNTQRNMSPEELEKALKWLEDLAAGRAKTGEVSADGVLDDSPFRSLFELEEGDLPDWLKESSAGEGSDVGLDMESRLDWLAKMAGRETIDELPTLEWRRLAGPSQAALIAGVVNEEPSTSQFSRVEAAAATPDTEEPQPPAETQIPPDTEASTEAVTPADPETPTEADAVLPAEAPTEPFLSVEPETPADPQSAVEQTTPAEPSAVDAEDRRGRELPTPTSADLGSDTHAFLAAALVPVSERPTEPYLMFRERELAEAAAAAVAAANVEPEADLPLSVELESSSAEVVDEPPTLPEIEDAAAAEVFADLPEEGAPDAEAEPVPETEGDIPELDDMDAAMAWLEELAFNQQTPLEDLPSVADRALASRLIAEASQVAEIPPVAESPTEAQQPMDGGEPAAAAEPQPEDKPKPKRKSRKRGSSAVLPVAAVVGAEVAQAATEQQQVTDEPPAAEINEPEIPTPVVAIEAAVADHEPPAAPLSLPDATDLVPIVEAELQAETPPIEAEAQPAETPTSIAAVSAAAATLTPMAGQTERSTPEPAERPSGVFALGNMLDVLDRIAVSTIVELNELEEALEAEGPAALATPYSLESTLDWLVPAPVPEPQPGPVTGAAAADALPPIVEAASAAATDPVAEVALAPSSSGAKPLSMEMSLLDQMPDDPDEALDWMRQFAEDEPAEADFDLTDATGAVVELSDSLLMEMPEDPDEAIAWIEQLSARGRSAA